MHCDGDDDALPSDCDVNLAVAKQLLLNVKMKHANELVKCFSFSFQNGKCYGFLLNTIWKMENVTDSY